MNRLAFKIRQRKYKESTETREWLILVGCLLAVALTVALAWARDEAVGDCYYSTGREVLMGKWKDVNGTEVCEHRNYGR
jgi:hypothetical protein